MNIEPVEVFRARVARHAALADPARLRIVDLLTLGDFSPTELQAELGMPSNLLSHHLRTLEDAGLATRHRSEADRRRSYIRLAAGRPGGPGARARNTGPAASCSSARGTAPGPSWPPHSGSRSATSPRRRPERTPRTASPGAPSTPPAATAWTSQTFPRAPWRQVAGDDDFIVTVCDNAHEELPSLGGIHWSVPDPLRLNTEDAFESAFDDIARRISDLAPRCTPPNPKPVANIDNHRSMARYFMHRSIINV